MKLQKSRKDDSTRTQEQIQWEETFLAMLADDRDERVAEKTEVLTDEDDIREELRWRGIAC